MVEVEQHDVVGVGVKVEIEVVEEVEVVIVVVVVAVMFSLNILEVKVVQAPCIRDCTALPST